jgi:hypothetical protein
MIEQFYRVKHVGIPFLAKAGMKVATTAARIKGGQARRLAEAGSIKLAVFEDQNFNGDFIKFRASLNEALNATWMPLIQTLSAESEEQVNLEHAFFFARDVDETRPAWSTKLRADGFEITGRVLPVSVKLKTLDVDALEICDQLFDLALVFIFVGEDLRGQAHQALVDVDVDGLAGFRREMIEARHLYARVLSFGRQDRREDKQDGNQCGSDIDGKKWFHNCSVHPTRCWFLI